MTPERTLQLEELLGEVKKEKGFWPTEKAFLLSTEVAAQFAIEVVIFGNEGKTVFLSQYEKPWKGETGLWHLPGGWAKPLKDKDNQALVSRIFQREIGVPIELRGILGEPYWWNPGEHDNPDSRPLSLYGVCRSLAPIEENSTRGFFPVDNPPQPLIGGSHANFFRNIGLYLQMARERNLLR